MTIEQDPRIAAIEDWMASQHNSIFTITMHAHALVNEAQQTLQDVEENDDNYLELQREFDVAASVYKHKSDHVDTLIDATQALASNPRVTRLHQAQCFAAGACAISCLRMLDAIPDDLKDKDAITGGLKEKQTGHLNMWKHLVGEV